MSDSQDLRLERIEKKLDGIQDALVTLARVEEKITDLEIRRQEQREEFLTASKQLEILDRKIGKIGEKADFHGKVIWYQLAGIMAYVGSQILMVLQAQ